MKIKLPISVLHTLSTLKQAKFEAFIVGGCVRDVLMGCEPKDWDVTTNATPEQMVNLFQGSKYENKFGTVLVPKKYLVADQKPLEKMECSNGEEKGIVEITTYRIETQYSDRRHPDEIKFAESLEEDLSRRDFTINAMAIGVKNVDKLLISSRKSGKVVEIDEKENELVDLFAGKEDLKRKLIRAVGDANKRFNEDALRMMRAIRFSVQIGFEIEQTTQQAIKRNAKNLTYISAERIKDELVKIILSQRPAQGIRLLEKLGLLHYILPELEQGIGVVQGYHHLQGPYPTVYEHLLASLEKCPSQKLEVRLAALLHDIGKPTTKAQKGNQVTFYNHEYAGAKIARQALSRLKFPKQVIEEVVLLIKNHMFYYNVDEVGESGVRRVITKVGLEHIHDLIDVRIADRLGSGVAKAVPYKLRHFKYMVEKVSHDPISVRQLKVNGNDLMQELALQPGPKIGAIMDVLLAKVIEQPELNEKNQLLGLAEDLMQLDLEKLRQMAKEKIKQEQKKEEKEMKGKYWVK